MKTIKDSLLDMFNMYKTSCEMNPIITTVATVVVLTFIGSIAVILGA